MNHWVGISILEMVKLKAIKDTDAAFSEKQMVKIWKVAVQANEKFERASPALSPGEKNIISTH